MYYNVAKTSLPFPGDVDSSERQVRTRIADIFERLRGIGQARAELQLFR